MPSDVAGWVYTIHFHAPLGDASRPRASAQHYTGWANDAGLVTRLLEHRRGGGAAIMAAVGASGISWHVSGLRRGTRHDERRMKQHGAARRCLTCRATTKGAGS
jgi:predicted GIY-YIG superfamily endonuclease